MRLKKNKIKIGNKIIGPHEPVFVIAEAGVNQKKNTGVSESQREMLKKLELAKNFYPKLIAHAKKRGIIFLSTPHGGFDSVDFLERFKIPAYKLGSGDLTNLPLIKYAGKTGKPIILSTGMGTLREVSEAVLALHKSGNKQIIILHCTTDYPTKDAEVNLRAMNTLASAFGTLLMVFSRHPREPSRKSSGS